ncbi:MAG: dienelactone hydrolase family protein [Planctomycetes bacterium]|nr:dienelactone hydrolase family protein [Planctomycetota bacterium]
MDSAFMMTIAEAIADHGIRVVRFEFPYMAARRVDGKRRPPNRTNDLIAAWSHVVETLGDPARLVIGGKSLGGRIASMIADEHRVAGLVCFGYPFHPPGKPDKPRTEHLRELATPTLILQGERDPFGTRDEVPDYELAKSIRVEWLPDGDHGWKPRVRSGHTEAENLARAAAVAAEFVRSV